MKHLFRSKWIRLSGGILAAVLLLTGAAWGYVNDYYEADETARTALVCETDDIRVEEQENEIVFRPRDPIAGMIFYPGGKVEYEAYAPLMRECAEHGILCVLVHMPANLAVLRPSAAKGIREQFPQITDWYIGGHSLGGAMAADYAGKHAEEFRGLILLAAYATHDLKDTSLRVLSVYGSEDGVLNRSSYEKNKELLPADFTEKVLDGGCHAYFGNYGHQDKDGEPGITNEEQVEMTAEEIYRFVQNQRRSL